MRTNNLLIIGPLPDYKNHIQFGGATVLMSNFIDYLNNHNIPFDFVQTNRFSNLKKGCNNRIKSSLWFIMMFFIKIWKSDKVMLNFSDSGVVSQYPILNRIVKLMGKKVILRKFGGCLQPALNEQSSKKRRRILNALNNTDLILIETKKAINELKDFLDSQIRVYWFPNVRKPSLILKNPMDYGKKLVFVSHITPSKGVDDILEVKKVLPEGYTIDLYGAITDDKYRSINWDDYDVRYHGEVESCTIPEILSKSSLLLLPSYKEGYPGIVIESFSVGLPVIVSNVGGLLEIVEDTVQGRVVPAGNCDALREAILSVTEKNYTSMCEASLNTFNRDFNSEKVNKRIVNTIEDL